MHPVQHRQHVRGDGLHAQRHPGEPGRAQLLEQLGRGGLRVGLGGDLGVRGQREVLPQTASSTAASAGAAQQRRCAAADEHGVHGGWRAQPLRGQRQLGAQRHQPLAGVRAAQFGGRIGVEVAIAAARRTERHMDIDAERSSWRGNHAGQLDGRRSDSHAASFPERSFAHRERKSRPVRAVVGVRGTIGGVTAAHIFPHRISLVARRHVDFKRVCTCCCLP